MRFLHLSDLHLGKRVCEFSMLEDQKYILDQILALLDNTPVDGVLLAGDLYDKPIPPAEAVRLLDWFLTQLAERGLPVFAISGNHDSADRIAFGAALLQNSRVYVSPVFTGAPQPIPLTDASGTTVDIYLLPFLKPAMVRHVWPEERIDSYDDALACVLRHCPRDPAHRSILLCHQFVAGAAACESEEVSVGGLDSVNVHLFDGFDYVALAHLHSPQKVGRDTVRYCGTPLKYSFSEAGQQKSATFVEVGADGAAVTTVPLTPRHELRQLRGSYMELTDRRSYADTAVDDYLHITLTDEQDIPDALARLRVIYPNLMRLDYDNRRTRENHCPDAPERTEAVTPLEYFAAFYQAQNNQPMTEEQAAYCQALIEEIWKEGEDA